MIEAKNLENTTGACEFADECKQYQRAIRQSDEDSVLQIDEVFRNSTRYHQTCYKNKSRKE